MECDELLLELPSRAGCCERVDSVSTVSGDGGAGSPLSAFASPCTPMRAASKLMLVHSSSMDELREAAVCPPVPVLDGLALSQLRALLSLEASGKYAVSPRYIAEVFGGSMVPKWRSQLVEWMEEVVREFRLSDATFFSAVQLLDRLFSAKRIAASQLQAFALTCCIICSKVHDSKHIRMVRGG